MRITADTNMLVRIIVRDDLDQAETALRILAAADSVYIPLSCLCEFAWVLDRSYAMPRARIASSVRAIMERANVSIDMLPAEAGLRVFEEGGDLADGVIAAAGAAKGSDAFISFDRNAVSRVKAAGINAEFATRPA